MLSVRWTVLGSFLLSLALLGAFGWWVYDYHFRSADVARIYGDDPRIVVWEGTAYPDLRVWASCGLIVKPIAFI